MNELTGFHLAAYLRMTLRMERAILELKSVGCGSKNMINAKHKTMTEMAEMGIVERVPKQKWTVGRPGTWYQLTGFGKDLAIHLEARRA